MHRIHKFLFFKTTEKKKKKKTNNDSSLVCSGPLLSTAYLAIQCRVCIQLLYSQAAKLVHGRGGSCARLSIVKEVDDKRVGWTNSF